MMKWIAAEQFLDLQMTNYFHEPYDHNLTKVSEAQFVEEQFNAGKRHAHGCLHSENPKVIIEKCAVSDDKEDPESMRRDELSRSLYFRRCDGRYKNMRGEVLEI